jgi:hypothetical protein
MRSQFLDLPIGNKSKKQVFILENEKKNLPLVLCTGIWLQELLSTSSKLASYVSHWYLYWLASWTGEVCLSVMI